MLVGIIIEVDLRGVWAGVHSFVLHWVDGVA